MVSCDCASLLGRLRCVSSAFLALLGFFMALVGVLTDVTTIYVYFHHGNQTWGILAAVLTVSLGWALNLFVAIENRDFLYLLQLGPARAKCEILCLLWWHRSDTAAREVAIQERNKYVARYQLATAFKNVSLLSLHSYVLLANQLRGDFAGVRYTGLDRLSQIGSIAAGVYFFAPALVDFLFHSPPADALTQAFRTLPRKLLFMHYFAADLCVRVLRIAVLTACLEAWAVLGLGIAWIFAFGSSFFVPRSDWTSQVVIASVMLVCSPVTLFGMSDNRLSDAISLIPLLSADAVVTVAALALPILIHSKPYVYLHGVCSSSTAGDCFPLPFLIAVGAVVLVQHVSARMLVYDIVCVCVSL